jgi:tight adherence protein B
MVGASDVRADLAAVVEATRSGASLGAALDHWAQARPVPAVRLAAAALSLAADAGGPQARAIDSVAATIRDRVSITRELDALTAQGRLSALVIAAAPVAFTAVTVMTDPRTAAYLFTSRPGNACLVAGLALDLAGGAWMACITAGVDP